MHCNLLPDSLAACTAGNSIPISMPIIAITTSISTRVNPLARNLLIFLSVPCLDSNVLIWQ